MIQLYHAPGSRSVRCRWLFEELGLAYEVVEKTLSPRDLKTPEYRAMNPLGRIPTVVDDEVVLFESGAILEYYLEAQGSPLAPKPGSAGRATYLCWFHWAEASAMPPVGDYLGHAVMRPEKERVPAMIENAKKRVGHVFQAIEDQVSKHDFIAGPQFSAADIMLGYVIHLAKSIGIFDAEKFPRSAAYFARLAERPAFVRATG